MRSKVAILLLALAATAGGAEAQRILAVSTAFSATHEAARIYLHSVDLQWGGPLPGIQSLRGVAAGPLLLSPNGKSALISSDESPLPGSPGNSATAWLAGVQSTPFALKTETRIAKPGARAVCLLEMPGQQLVRVLMLASGGNGHATAYAVPWDARKHGAFGAPGHEWELPGPAVAVKRLPSGAQAAALCARREGGTALAILDLASNAPPLTVPIGDKGEEADARPAGLAVTPDERYVLALVSGFGPNAPAGEPVSWLHVYDAANFTPVCAPLEITGSARPEDNPIHPEGGQGWWVASVLPGTGFAYATCVRFEGGVLAKAAEYALNGVPGSFELAVSPGGAAVAVAVERRLEIWPNGERAQLAVQYEDAIRVLHWDNEHLLLAEGPCLHAVNPATGEPVKTAQLEDGQVTDFVVVPERAVPQDDEDADGLSAEDERRLGSSPASPDSDGDGLPDGSDPAPRTPTPWLETRPLVTFRGEAVGREVQCLPIAIHQGEDAVWRVSYDAAALPWLRLHPTSGKGPGFVYMGVDPAHASESPSSSGALRVDLMPSAPAERMGPARESWVRVAPGRSLPPKVLWIWPDEQHAGIRDDSDPRRMKALADLLSAPPHFFAHQEVTGPYNDSLEPYTIVVIGAEAAALGAVTRQAVLDYVKNGGALLFIGKYLEAESSRALTDWLSPLAIRINTAVQVNGRFAVAGDQRVLRYWRDFEVKDGCAIGAEKGYVLEQGGAKGVGAVCVAREYGLGRIVLLAASTPLETAALAKAPERVFADELFTWLARARVDFEDSDGDALPDSLEDANGNGAWDAGETDYRDPDTDGDGLSDGVEDVNSNARVDDGETDPRNPDSDDDGVFDGADSTPCPVFGSPVLLSMLPQTPAEGGRIVIATGENFTPDSVFWFGERRAPSVRVVSGSQALVLTPDFGEDEGGETPVSVMTNQGQLEGVLPGGYQYSPRSRVRITLIPAITAQTEAERSGELLIRAEVPAGVVLGRVVLILRADPEAGFVWGEITPGDAARAAGAKVYGRSLGGALLVVAESAPRLFGKTGDLVRITWRHSAASPPLAPVHVSAAVARAFTRKDARLAVDVESVSLTGDNAPPEPAKKPSRERGSITSTTE